MSDVPNRASEDALEAKGLEDLVAKVSAEIARTVPNLDSDLIKMFCAMPDVGPQLEPVAFVVRAMAHYATRSQRNMDQIYNLVCRARDVVNRFGQTIRDRAHLPLTSKSVMEEILVLNIIER